MSWVYDGFGNRTAQNVVKGSVPVQSISVDMNTNRVTSWSYDANGNATSIPGVGTITYDASNRVKTAGGETYEYDPSNKRIWKNDTFTFWGGKGERVGTYSVTLMSDTTGSPTQWKLAFVKQSEDWYFGGRRLNQVQDRLGSVRRDSSLTSQSYYPYGEERTSTANPADKFATYHRDGTGLDYADQRYYASSSGRFISSDPYQASGLVSKPASWNRYTYVESDPANGRDRRGLARDCDPNNFRDPTSATLFCPPDGGGGRIDSGHCSLDGISVPCGLFRRADAAMTPEQWQAWYYANLQTKFVLDVPGTSGQPYGPDLVVAFLAAVPGLANIIDIGSIRPQGNGFSFSFIGNATSSDLIAFLTNNPYFASGSLGALHGGDVSGTPHDFRTFTGPGTSYSMQIVVGSSAGIYVDLDFYNPYQDILSFLGHAIIEVVGGGGPRP